MYTQLMVKQGAKLTKAAYELTEKQSRMLYKDMFKPQERSKKNENLKKLRNSL